MNKSTFSNIIKAIKDIGEVSSCIGVSRFFLAKRFVIKAMWLIVLVVLSAYGINESINALLNYLEFDVITNIEVINEISTEFPAVTFYNLKNNKANISLNEIMVSCRYQSEGCTADDFEMIQDKFGYVSYRFKNKKYLLPGFEYGLNVIIYNFNVSNFRALQDGLRIIVHDRLADPGYYGGYLTEGKNVPTGFFSDLTINRVSSNKLGEPYNRCLKKVSSVDSFDSDLFKYILTSTNYSYRQKDCLLYCLGKEMLKYNNITNEIDNPLNVWMKLNNTNSLLDVFTNFTKSGLRSECTTLCPLECDSVYYDVLSSLSKLVVNKDGIEYFNKFMSFKINENHSADHLIGFSIYFNDLKSTKISQTAKFELFDLISNIGGLLGLFTGFTFLSCIELLELILEIFFIIYDGKKM